MRRSKTCLNIGDATVYQILEYLGVEQREFRSARTRAALFKKLHRFPGRAGYQAQHFGTGRARQRIELAQLILTGRTSQSDAHEESTFAAAGTLKQREPFRS